MKPSALLACVTICFPAGLVVLAGLPGRSNLDSQSYSKSNLPLNLDSSRQFNKQVLIASAESTTVYVKTRLDITLEQLSLQLDIPSDYLADLNDCDVNRKFSNNEWVAIPALLIMGAVHHHLVRAGKRMKASLVSETGEARDVHQIACLIGYGASAINPYLALETIREIRTKGSVTVDHATALLNYKKAISNGLLKIMSKMGISVIGSYIDIDTTGRE
jgi:hypothetical protein